jgi:hypothetical protein
VFIGGAETTGPERTPSRRLNGTLDGASIVPESANNLMQNAEKVFFETKDLIWRMRPQPEVGVIV